MPTPSDYSGLYQGAGQAFGVDPNLLQAIVTNESGGDPNALSSQGAQGAAQIMPKTAAALNVTDPDDPGQSVYGAAKLVSQLSKQYGGNIPMVVAAYHGGTNQANWGPKTAAYQSKVLGTYKQLAGGAPAASDADQAASYQELTGAVPSWSQPPASTAAPSSATPTAAPAQSDADAYKELTGTDMPAPGSPPAATPASSSAAAAPLPGLTQDPRDPMVWRKGDGTVGYIGGPNTSSAPTNGGPVEVDINGSAAPDRIAAYLKAHPDLAAPPAPIAKGGEWDMGTSLANGMWLGQGGLVRGATDAVGRFGNDLLSNQGIGTALGDAGSAFNEGRNTFNFERNAFDAAHPVQGAVGELGGNLLMLPVAEAGLGGTASAGGNVLLKGLSSAPQLAGAVPALSATGDFLSGASDANQLLSYGSKAANGAVRGATAAGLTSGELNAPLPEQLGLGAVFGAGAPAIFGAGRGIINHLTGSSITPEIADLADAAVNKYGIPLRAGQISQSPGVSFADSAIGRMPFSGYGASTAAQQSAFTRAVSRTFGEDTDSITPTVMQGAKQRLGGVFDDVASKTGIQADDDLLNNLGSVYSDAAKVVPDSELKPLGAQIDNILQTADDNGVISGDSYQALTRKGAPLDRAMNSSDPNVSYYAGQMRDALDDAMARSADPKDLARLSQARLQYKNLMTVAPLVVKGAPGEISPAALQGRVTAKFSDAPFNGGGDLGQLAQIGQNFLKEPPSSGTAERLGVYGALGGGAVTAANLLLHDPKAALGMMGAGVATAGSGRIAGMLLNNPVYRHALLDGGQQAADAWLPVNNMGGQIGLGARNLLLAPPPARTVVGQ